MLRNIFYCNYWGGAFLVLLLATFQVDVKGQIPTCTAISCPKMFVEIVPDPNFPSTFSCPNTSLSPCGGGDQFRQLFFKVRLVAYPDNGILNFDLSYNELNITLERAIPGPPGAQGYSFIDETATLACHALTATANSWPTSITNGVTFIAEEETASIQFNNNYFPCPDAAVIHFSPTIAAQCPPTNMLPCAKADLFTVVVNAYPGEVVQLNAILATYQPIGGSTCNITVLPSNATALAPVLPINTQNSALELRLKDAVSIDDGGFSMDVELVNSSPAPNTLDIDYLEFVLKVAANQEVTIDIPGAFDRPILPQPLGISDKFIQMVVPDQNWTLPSGSSQLVGTITVKPKLTNIDWNATVSLLEANKTRIKTVQQPSGNKACTSIALGGSKTFTQIGVLPCTFDDGGVLFTIEGIEDNTCGTYPFIRKVKVGFVDTDQSALEALTLLGLQFDLDITTTGPVTLTTVNFPGSGWLTCGGGGSGCYAGACHQITNSTGQIQFSFCRIEPTNTFTITPDAFIELVFEGAGCIDEIKITSLSLKRNGDPSPCIPDFDPAPYDNIPLCMGEIFGIVTTEDGHGVEAVGVSLDPEGCVCPQKNYLTGSSGAYGFCACDECQYFKVTPEKDDNPLNGVTTYDLVLISKHILANPALNSPYKMIAADANSSETITTFDIVELRKLILGIYTELPNNTSWRFVPKSFSFPNANNPFQTVFPESKNNIDKLENPPVSHDFTGIKVGDVNNTVVANRPLGKRPQTLLNWPELKAGSGEVITLPIRYAGTIPLDAIQLGLKFDPTILQLISPSLGDLPDWTAAAFNLSGANRGEIRSIWLPFDLDNPDRQAKPGDVLFYLTFKVLAELPDGSQALWYDDSVLPNAAWSMDGTEYALEHQSIASKRMDGFTNGEKIDAISVICHPNPSTGNLAFTIQADQSIKGNIAVFSPFGVRLLARDVMLNAGIQEITLPEAAQLPSGVYVWKILAKGALSQGHWVKQ